MTEEERNHYRAILVEKLYSDLQLVYESSQDNKKKIIENIVKSFFDIYKDDYNFESIDEVIKEVEKFGKAYKNKNSDIDLEK